MQQRPRSPWKLVRLGCAAFALVTVVTIVVFLFVGHRMARNVRAQMDDPALRLASAREVLHTASLPDGYAATLAITVPLLGRVVVLEGPQRRLFLYLESRGSEPTDNWAEDLDRLLGVRGLEIEPGPVLI